MSDNRGPDDYLEPLDLSKWNEKDRKVIERVRDLLTHLNPARIEEHRTLIPILPDGLGDFEHLIGPTVYALLAHGKDGLAALYQLAIEDALAAGFVSGPVLVCAAIKDRRKAAGKIHFAQRYLDRDAYSRLQDRVVASCQDPETSAEAKRFVSKLISHYASDPARRHRLATVLGGLTSIEPPDSEASKLIWGLMGSATLQISGELCNEAADLIHQDLTEAEYQRFFEQHPALLDPLAASAVPRQALGEMWRTDFVIRRFDDQYVFVELEKPRDALFTAYPQPSASLAHALGQVPSA
jgi:hypothetical protein